MPLKYKFKSKALESRESEKEGRRKWDRQRKENTEVCGVVTKNRLPCQDSCFVLKQAEFPSIYQKNKASNNFKTDIL